MEIVLMQILRIHWDRIKNAIMDRGLQFRLVLLFAFVSLVPLLALGFFSYYKSSNTIQDITSKYSSDIISEINTNMLLRFKNCNDIGKVLLSNSTVKEILSRNPEQTTAHFSEDDAKMNLLLKTINDSNENIRSVYILAQRNGNIFAFGDVTRESGLVFLNTEYRKNYRESTLYKNTVDSNGKYIWWPTQNVLGKNVFILTEKLYDEREGILGVLVIHVGAEIMDGIYSSIKTGMNSKMYLLDDSGRILFHPDKAHIGKQLTQREILERISQKEEGSFIIKENNRAMFVVYNTFSVTGWKSVVITRYDELISGAVNIRDATLLLSSACLAFVLLLSVFVSKSILNPIYKLIRLMKKGSTGDMKVRFNVKYNDEIGQLGNSFNKMMTDIEKLIEMVEKESREKVEAEIKALEAHINPHFLYNTLASIYWSAMAKGDHEIGKMAASLSKFFRLGLNKGKEFTTVENEVEHVKEFLSIQKMLYSSLFDYEIVAFPDLHKYKTIKLILQPLVENSLIHGMKKKKDKGLIRVEVTQKEDRIFFRVTDNGIGIEDLKERGLESIIECGYGLKNIRDRVRLYFDNDFTLSCASTPGESTVFEISIPAVSSEEVGRSVQAVDH